MTRRKHSREMARDEKETSGSRLLEDGLERRSLGSSPLSAEESECEGENSGTEEIKGVSNTRQVGTVSVGRITHTRSKN